MLLGFSSLELDSLAHTSSVNVRLYLRKLSMHLSDAWVPLSTKV
jgi:hypothetical protein